jgi:HAD superfamily hydrolase (TIGR01548 family)
MSSDPAPSILLLDMDGVLAEVSQSYRAAIVATCHAFGATAVNLEIIGDKKAKGGCNNDWVLSYDLIREYSPADNIAIQQMTLDQVTATFEDFYQGTPNKPGLCKLESLIPTRETLEELRRRCKKIAVVTGRPRKDCDKFLKQHRIDHLVDACVCMEDGPPKPDPFPLIRACELVGHTPPDRSVIMVGDTPDDIRAAVAAKCRAVGVSTPDAVEQALAQGLSYESTKLAVAMKECGADVILEPGFAALVDLFPSPSS